MGMVAGGGISQPFFLWEWLPVPQVPLGLLGLLRSGVGCAPRNARGLWLECGAGDGGFGFELEGVPDAPPSYWGLLCSDHTFGPGSLPASCWV